MFFDLAKANASGGLNNQSIHITGRYPGYSITSLAPFLQSSDDINERFALSGGAIGGRKTKPMILSAIANSQGLQTARPAPPTPFLAAYDNTLFNADLWMHITERQQAWFNFSRGVKLPDPGKYYGNGNYRLVNGHYQLVNSVNVARAKLQGIKVAAGAIRAIIYVTRSRRTTRCRINRLPLTVRIWPVRRKLRLMLAGRQIPGACACRVSRRLI